MHVRRWGNSLAMRLSAALVEAVGLLEGDEVAIEVALAAPSGSPAAPTVKKAVEALRRLGWHLPTIIFHQDVHRARLHQLRRARRGPTSPRSYARPSTARPGWR